MHKQEEFADYLRQANLTDLSEEFSILAEKLWEERRYNKGLIPYEVFNQSIGMGGSYTTIIAIPRVVNESGKVLGYAHKLREVGDDGWSGYYHQPGTLMRTTQPDPFGEALQRLTQEFFGGNEQYQGRAVTELGFGVTEIPVAFVWEAFRRAFATRIAFFIDIPEAIYEKAMCQESGKEWVLVENPHETDLSIIPFEIDWLRWAVSDNRSLYPLIVPEEDVLS
jgi:hypothetical protein